MGDRNDDVEGALGEPSPTLPGAGARSVRDGRDAAALPPTRPARSAVAAVDRRSARGPCRDGPREPEGRAASGAPPSGEPMVLADRYRLEVRVGNGGQGEVWRALDTRTGERVAVKVLFGRASSCSDARTRREIASLRLLDLPGVVRLRDEGVDEGVAYLVMDWVEGVPFPGAAPPRPWAEIATPALGLLETLGRVHAAGIVHRDLKPANVFVGPEGRTTLLDFGLSRLNANANNPLTGQDDVLGTPPYSAPEQFNSNPITPRTDLYAYGLLLYEALTGALPHRADTLDGLLRQRLTLRPPPISERSPDVPPAVARAIERLLAPDPDDRPPSADEALALFRGEADALAPAFAHLGSPAPLEALARALDDGASIDVVGPRGSGRTYCLREVARRAEAQGRAVVWAEPSDEPFGSLVPALGACGGGLDQSLRELEAGVERALARELGAGLVLLVDDAERVDHASSLVIERCRGAGFVARALLAPRAARGAGGAADAREVRLEPLGPRALAELFAGPDRVVHLREDAARLLFERSEGNAARAVQECSAWVRAGLARRDGPRLAVERAALDRIEAGLDVAPLPKGAPRGSALPKGKAAARFDELAAWASLAWPQSDAKTLSAAMGAPLWQAEAKLRELVEAGHARELADGRVAPNRGAPAHLAWPWPQRRAAHRALARALAPGEPRRLFHLVASADVTSVDDNVALAREAEGLAARYIDEGEFGKAVSVLEHGLGAARRLDGGGEAIARALLTHWAEAALASHTPGALDAVLFEIARTKTRSPELAHLDALVRAALAVNVWTERSLTLIEAVAPFDDPRLELRRHDVRVRAARRTSLAREEAMLREVEPWVESTGRPEVRAAFDGWLGRLRYRQGHFVEAARLHHKAARAERSLVAQATARLNAASSWLEAFRLERAGRLARSALLLLRGRRHAFLEGRAEWLLRCVAWRLGRARSPDRELIEAIGRVGEPELEAFVRFNEAAVAWKSGDVAFARELAGRSFRYWQTIGQPVGALLAEAFLLACGEPAPEARLRELVERACFSPIPGVGIQALALVGASGRLPAVPAATIEALAHLVPRRSWGTRMELLSVDEALAYLRQAEPLALDGAAGAT